MLSSNAGGRVCQRLCRSVVPSGQRQLNGCTSTGAPTGNGGLAPSPFLRAIIGRLTRRSTSASIETLCIGRSGAGSDVAEFFTRGAVTLGTLPAAAVGGQFLQVKREVALP